MLKCELFAEDGSCWNRRNGKRMGKLDEMRYMLITGVSCAYILGDVIHQYSAATNQETVGSKLERTSYLTFYGSQRHLKAFQVVFLV